MVLTNKSESKVSLIHEPSYASTGDILESWASSIHVSYQKTIPMPSWRFTAFVNWMKKYKNVGSDVGELPQLEIFNILQG